MRRFTSHELRMIYRLLGDEIARLGQLLTPRDMGNVADLARQIEELRALRRRLDNETEPMV